MPTLSSQIATIELKIKALIEENVRLKTQNEQQKAEMSLLEDDNKELVEALKVSEERIVALKTANAMLGSDDYKTKTKLKINALIRELDQCIDQIAS
ncbi:MULTISPECIES: hypothetical protein [Nonlabens]|uniref:Uncharacterized protein n=1 Tax=Nonlabens ulvanivorans TaxID=906888 RepID=A0A081DDS1_NONUL|nr:hypothetical protein [Nonlabens ulvanivorans]KEZ93865.1 hypothetical protein IL45_06615 [Nonlabens ulvanivorans]PRX14472.1 hypothetical protein LY02_01503 [Nonlabens ulvanivorans]WOI22989.1 hypothetical protein R1T42_00795 [Nonlabens ulvanivorans]GAK77067.1 hypothetical protein JCM19296_2671 [Nonlabens ulvanivorans]GAK95096.1 hypothetical protein JCM19298_873 [Nonlabens ulvanivorans]